MAANIPPEFHGADDTWIAGSARSRTIVYHTGLADPAKLQHLMDLTAPAWEGKLGITVSSNASFIGGLAAMIRQEGAAQARRFLEGIKRNAGDHVYPNHTPVVSAVARGEVAVGLVNQYYFYRAIAQNPKLPIGIVYPDQDTHGSVLTTTGLGILRHAKHPEAARKFIDFVLSDEGQKIFAEVNYEFPVNPRVERHPLLPKPGTIRFSPVSQALQTATIDEAIELIRQVGMQ
jgi:iron(III) transport system substrate-binding protein